MKIAIENKDSAVIIHLEGDLDYNTCNSFNEKITTLIDQSLSPLVINMTGVAHIDSMGLGSLTRLWKDASNNNSKLVLASVPKNVGKLIGLINLDQRIEIFETVENALQ